MIRSFPLLAIPMALYNLIVMTSSWSVAEAAECSDIVGYAVHPLTCDIDVALLRIPTASRMQVYPDYGAEGIFWAVTLGDVLLTLSLLLLFVEVLKSTASHSASIINHALSFVVFVVGLIQFMMIPAFSTSVFFLITLMAVLDVLGGFIVTIATARRDVALG